MEARQEVLLRLEGVGRVYPRDVSDTPSSLLREMFLPLRALAGGGPMHFHALREVSLSLARGETSGVLGSHRSGKSTLAAIAAGVMRPTSGSVVARGSRSLVARPTAGFKPGLTVLENLSFRAVLQGLTGDALQAAIARTLATCGVSQEQAGRATGNLSPHLVKQLGMTLLLEVPAEILVIDELSGAGAAAARRETRARLVDKLEAGTALVVSSDPAFVREVADRAWVLHQARLYGPFEVEQAIEAFGDLPPEDEEAAPAAFDPMNPPRASAGGPAAVSSAGYDYDADEDEAADEDEDPGAPLEPKPGRIPGLAWRSGTIWIDGEEFQHSRQSLLRPPGARVQVALELACLRDTEFTGGMFALHGGSSGTEAGRLPCPHDPVAVVAGEKRTLRFEFVVPDWGEDFYGLTFCPQSGRKHFVPEHRIKILIFGVGRKHGGRPQRVLEVRNSSFERKTDHASVDSFPRSAEGQQATGQVGGEVWAAP